MTRWTMPDVPAVGEHRAAGGGQGVTGGMWTNYRVNAGQGHTIRPTGRPIRPASLFSLAANPAEEWPDWIQPTGAHNAYAGGG